MAKYYRSAVVNLINSWEGLNEKNGSHKKIIDIYNNKMPNGKFPRGTKMQYDWAWCACTWSALAIELGYTKIMPIEISVKYLVDEAKKMGIWQENDAHVPSVGDAVVYDWDDNGVGDNTGNPDHVGTVVSVDTKAGTFAVMEGNYQDSVKKRTMKINGRYIRGFICPKYDDEPESSKATVKEEPKTQATKIDPAQSKDANLAGQYKVTASSLNMRSGAGIDKGIVCVLPENTVVNNYGYYTKKNDKKWLLSQATIKGVVYTGFCSEAYLKKVK